MTAGTLGLCAKTVWHRVTKFGVSHLSHYRSVFKLPGEQLPDMCAGVVSAGFAQLPSWH